MLKTINKQIAVTPFVTHAVGHTVRHGVVTLDHKTALAKLTVLYSSDDGLWKEGDVVHVRGDLAKHQNSKDVFEIEPGKPFILIADSSVLMVERVASGHLNSESRLKVDGPPVFPPYPPDTRI